MKLIQNLINCILINHVNLFILKLEALSLILTSNLQICSESWPYSSTNVLQQEPLINND